MGKFKLTDAEQREMAEMELLCKLLSAQWGMDIQLKKRIAIPLLAKLKVESFAGKNNLFLFPMDDVSIANMGLAPEQHREIFLGFAFERNRLSASSSGLDPRIARTDLQIIGALLAELKINPNSPHATGKLAKILERHGVYVSRDTLDARMKDIKKAGKVPAISEENPKN